MREIFGRLVMLFGLKKAATNEKLPLGGEKWFFKEDESPWAGPRYRPVTIIDVKDGWVRYDMGLFRDQRMKIDSFLYCYRFLCATQQTRDS